MLESFQALQHHGDAQDLDNPDPWEDLESRTPLVVPYTIIGPFLGAPKGDLLSRSMRSGNVFSAELILLVTLSCPTPPNPKPAQP